MNGGARGRFSPAAKLKDPFGFFDDMEPDMENAHEAVAFAKKLQLILQYLGASEANMDKGQMRCEVNISMRNDKGELGTKVEIKNLNSFAAIKEAIEFETQRQSSILNKGDAVLQETRGWDENKKMTVSQRLKESAHDYRYFPEPDLPVIIIDPEDVARLRAALPELPEDKKQRFLKEFGLSENDSDIIISDKAMAAFFEHVISELAQWVSSLSKENRDGDAHKKHIKLAVNYLNTDVRGLLSETGATVSDMMISPENFAELISMLIEKTITSPVAKIVLGIMFHTGKDPSVIVTEQGLAPVHDEKELEEKAAVVIAANVQAVADYRSGNQNALQFLVGKVMAETRGQADPELSRTILIKLLG